MQEPSEYFQQTRGTEKNFGLVFSAVFFLFTVYLFLQDNLIWVLTITFCLIFFIISFTNPKIFYLANIIWFKIGMSLGSIVAPLVMGLIFILVVIPTGFLLKLFGKNPLKKSNKNELSYWVKRKYPMNSMKDQF